MPSSKQAEIARKGARTVTGPRSLTRLLALFDALSASPDGMTLAELSVTLGSPKSSLLNLLRPLVTEAYLIHGGGFYRLGPSIFRLASRLLDTWQLLRIMRPFMEELAASTGESVLLSVMNAEKKLLTYVDIVHSAHPVRYQIAVGTVRPLYASTAGRLLVAYADRAWRQDYLAKVEFDGHTSMQMTKAWLKRDLEQIVEDGVAWSVDGFMVGLSAVAAPLFDASGACVASLNIAGPTDRFRADLDSRKAAVRECATRASKALAAAEKAAPAALTRVAGRAARASAR